jgi:hypothetical protein
VRWPCCCIYCGSCEHPGTGWWPFRKAEAIRASDMTVLVNNGLARLVVPMPGCATTWPVCTHVVNFFQAHFELYPYDVEKWAASRWNHRQLKIDRRQLDLWYRL